MVRRSGPTTISWAGGSPGSTAATCVTEDCPEVAVDPSCVSVTAAAEEGVEGLVAAAGAAVADCCGVAVGTGSGVRVDAGVGIAISVGINTGTGVSVGVAAA